MSKVSRYLNRHLTGNVFDRVPIREAYMSDRSMLYTVPRLVAIPETTTDLRKIVRFSHQLAKRKFRLPITVRGGGNDKTGAAIGSGMLISMQKMNHVQEIDVRNHLVRVQAGITLEELNTALSLHGLMIPIAGHEKDTIGGLIANCPTDDYAGKYGGIYHSVEQIEVVLSNSDLLQTKILHQRGLEHHKEEKSFTGDIYNNLDALMADHEMAIQELTYGGLDSAGYSTIALVRRHGTFDLLPLFFNSQGTLGVISEVILRAKPLPKERRRVLLIGRNVRSMLGLLKMIKDLEPLALNIYDTRIFRRAIDYGNKSRLFVREPRGDIIVLASFDHSRLRNRRILQKIVDSLPRSTRAIVEDDGNIADFQDLDSMLLSYLNDGVYGERVPVVDDVRIPEAQLASFISSVKKLEQELGVSMPVYGSFMTDNYSVRPEVTLKSASGRHFVMKFLRSYTKLVEKHHGSITGGSPEGGTKALMVHYTPEQREIYTEIKNIFDPDNIFNPHIKLGATPRTVIRRLRRFHNRQIVEP